MYKPMPTQVEDSDAMLVYQHALLWSMAGTGKTVTAIEAFKKGDYDRIIVIAPRIALTMWAEELDFHGRLRHIHVIRSGGAAKSAKGQRAAHEAQALIVTYDLCRNKDVSAALLKFVKRPGKCAVVLDEHQQVKNPEAARTAAVLGKACDGRGVFTGHADDVWFLSGDPIMAYQNDLFPALRFARPDVLAHYRVDTYPAFMETFCVVERKSYSHFQRVIKPRAKADRNTKLLLRLLKDCRVIQRTLDDVEKDMPELTQRTVTPELPTSIEKRVIAGMSDAQIIAAINDPDSQLSKIRRLLGLAKAGPVAQYVEEQSPPLLIGAWHKDVIDELASQLSERKPNWVIETVTGHTPDKERDRIREQFNAGEVHALIGQMGAMSVSWNLQSTCRQVIIAEELPSYGVTHQFYSRVYRKGQVNHVQVDHMTSEHELDTVLRRIRDNRQATKETITRGLSA